MTAGEPGRPISRDSCGTVISVGAGMAASTSGEDMDAMFQPRPHGAIAIDPLPTTPYDFPGDVNGLATQLFKGRGRCQTSLTVAGRWPLRRATILGTLLSWVATPSLSG